MLKLSYFKLPHPKFAVCILTQLLRDSPTLNFEDVIVKLVKLTKTPAPGPKLTPASLGMNLFVGSIQTLTPAFPVLFLFQPNFFQLQDKIHPLLCTSQMMY